MSLTDYYSNSTDIKIYNKLEKLFSNWQDYFYKSLGLENGKISDMFWNKDGIFPGYSKSKFKLLFIARENRIDYLEKGLNDFERADQNQIFLKINEWKNRNYPSRSNFWRRIVRIVYGIRNDLNYDKFDDYSVEKIIDEMVSNNDFGFGFIDLSKIANPDKDGGRRNINTINCFLNHSTTEFFMKEISILNPDLIVTLNLWKISKIAGEFLRPIFMNTAPEKNKIYETNKINNKTFNFIDTYHFSACRKNEDFYIPILEAYKYKQKLCK